MKFFALSTSPTEIQKRNHLESIPSEKTVALSQLLTRMFTLRLFVPAILLAVLLISTSGYLYARLIEQQQIQLSQSIASQTEGYLDKAGEMLLSFSQVGERGSNEAFISYLETERTNHDYFSSFLFFDKQGQVIFTIPSKPSSDQISMYQAEIGQIRFAATQPYVSGLTISPLTGLRTVLIAQKMQDGRTIVGELNLISIQQSILESQSSLQEGQLVFLSDESGSLMAGSNLDLLSQQAALSYFHPVPVESVNLESRLVLDGREPVFVTQSRLARLNWILVSEIPLRIAIAPYLWILWVSLTLLILFWAWFVFMLNRQGVKKIITPLRELSQVIQSVAEGNIEQPAFSNLSFPFTEAHELAANFEKMFTALQQRQNTIKESEQKYRMLIDQSSDAIYVEFRGKFIITNQKFNEMFGIGRDEPQVSTLGFLQFVTPASRPLVKDLQRQVLDGLVGSMRYEFSAKSKDGRDIDLEASTSALPYMDGVAVQSILRDISERKRSEQAEREQRILAEALRDTASALNNTLEVNEVIDRIFSNASKVVPFQAASIMLLDSASPRQARIIASFGYQHRGSQNRLRNDTFQLEEYQNLKVMLDTGRPLAISDTVQSPVWKSSLETRWVRSYAGAPIRLKGKVIGFLNLDVDIPHYYTQIHAERLQAFADQAGIAIHNAQLLTDLRASRDELYKAYETTLEGWSKALELRDYETEGHTQRVMDMTMQLAESYGIIGPELLRIRYGTLLHDIGKIGIPDAILFKPGPLNEEEWEVMRRHPVYAKRILAHIPYLQDSLDIPFSHHEKWDGSGYPQGLKGEEIPLPARLFAVVDVWDGLRSNRHYRSGWPEADVIQYIRDQSGKHFDPRVVELFMQLLGQESITISA